MATTWPGAAVVDDTSYFKAKMGGEYNIPTLYRLLTEF
ncbi:hypothetical protein MNBD_GAMMA21-1224 [hydrothermal vent metagenome]|uniref:Uncharacterized protein n=1 Tax=hydrothermal vent metagenome TaxID=652676 RepID=A0A3B0ZFR0_9ZZZZ